MARVALERGPRAALLVAALVVVALLVGAFLGGIPSSGHFGFWETLAQLFLVFLYCVGWWWAWHHHMAGATLMAVTGTAVAILAVVKLQPIMAMGLLLLLFGPTAVMWWFWTRDRGLRRIIEVAVVFTALMVGSWWLMGSVFRFAYGPQAAVSPFPALDTHDVEWLWSGALEPDSFRVVARLTDEHDEQRVGLRVTSGVVPRSWWADAVAGPDNTVSFEVAGLYPGRDYDYSVIIDGVPDTSIGSGSLRTPEVGPQDFTFAFASCARTRSNAATFDSIKAQDPLFFLHMGDFFYADIAEDDPALFHRAYNAQLTQPAQSGLYRQVPIAYIWDDHDFGPNDSNRESPGRPAAMSTYRDLVPSYDLPLGDDEGPISQAFTIGRVRFVLLDVRSMRDPHTWPDGSDKTMIGQEQREWLFTELAEADRYGAVVLFVGVPWIAVDTGGDDWSAYAEERRLIADAIVAQGIDNLIVVAGDAHMLAADDGSNTNFSGTPGPSFPLLQAAPLDQHTSVKGGPYSEGVVTTSGQYGLLHVHDDGTDLRMDFEGRDAEGNILIEMSWDPPT